MNSFGRVFRISIYGESHGAGVGVLIDGAVPGIPLSMEDFLSDLARRKPGKAGTTSRIESDLPELLSGIHKGHTTGAPINIFFRNSNTDSKVYLDFRNHPRPGHADFTSTVKYQGFNDLRGSGHFSGRMTLALVAAGTVAKKILGEKIEITSEISKLGRRELNNLPWGEREEIIQDEIFKAQDMGDSLGGVVECRVKNLPPGLGEPFFDSAESLISHLAFSIPGVKGIEFGSGFPGCEMYGSQFNDRFISEEGETESNNNGGINGGITNGNDLVFRIAVKPTSSIFKAQESFNFAEKKMEKFEIKGRHDAAFILRVPVVAESVGAIALADMLMLQKLYR